MNLSYAVDRISDSDWVVLENDDGRTFSVPRAWLPSGVREGDIVTAHVLAVSKDSSQLEFGLDDKQRQRRLDDASRRREALPKATKGDFSL